MSALATKDSKIEALEKEKLVLEKGRHRLPSVDREKDQIATRLENQITEFSTLKETSTKAVNKVFEEKSALDNRYKELQSQLHDIQ